MIVAALATALLSARQATAGVQGTAAGQVTIATGLLSTERTLAELSKATGLDLRASPATADLPLMVRVNGLETRIVLGRIAEVLGAEWRASGAGYILTSDAALRRKLARAPDERRIARFETSLAAAQAATKDLQFDEAFATRTRKEGERIMASVTSSVEDGGKGFDPSSLLRSPALTQTPASQAINDLLAGIGAPALATLPRGERVVYALTPTAMQIALPNGSRALLDRYTRANAAYTQAIKNTATGDEMDFLSMMGGAGAMTGQGPIGDAHLELWPGDGMISARLVLFDTAGKSLGAGFSFLDVSPPQPPAAMGGDPLAVSDLGREWGAKLRAASAGIIDPRDGFSGMTSMFGGARDAGDALSRPSSPALRALLADPVGQSLGAPLFEPVAAAMSGDLIATVPDAGLAFLAGLVSAKETTAVSAIGAIEASPLFSITRDGTLTVVGAATPARLREGFADRHALRALVADLTRDGYLRLDDAARYALAQREETGARHLGAPIVAILQGKPPFAFGGDPLVSQFQALRVYGSLTAAQRSALVADRPVPYTALSAEANDAIGRILFDSPAGPLPRLDESEESDESDESENVEESAGETMGEVSSFMRDWNTRAAERTVRFADGVPRGGYLTMTSTTTDTYRLTDSSTGTTAFGDAEMLGFLRGAKDLPMFRNFVGTAQYDRFTPAHERSLTFQFVFAPKLASSASLEDHEVSAKEGLTYDQLPAEFRARVEESAKAAAMMKASPGRVKP